MLPERVGVLPGVSSSRHEIGEIQTLTSGTSTGGAEEAPEIHAEELSRRTSNKRRLNAGRSSSAVSRGTREEQISRMPCAPSWRSTRESRE